jgi:hypothetical protein
MNEAVFIDDKSGVDFFRIPTSHRNSSANGTKPVTGLEKTPKVIVSAGNKTQTFALDTTVFRNPRYYSPSFYPTEQTAYWYILIGTISNTPINIKWTGFVVTPESTSSSNSIVKNIDGVVRNVAVLFFMSLKKSYILSVLEVPIGYIRTVLRPGGYSFVCKKKETRVNYVMLIEPIHNDHNRRN